MLFFLYLPLLFLSLAASLLHTCIFLWSSFMSACGISYCGCLSPFSRVLAPSLSSALHQSFFFSLHPPPHSYTLSPLSFGALQWLHHHIGDTTALAKTRSLFHSRSLSLSLFYARTHTHTCFIPRFLSFSLFCSQKAYLVQVRQSLENEPKCNLSHFHIKKLLSIWNNSTQIALILARATCGIPHAVTASFRSPILLKWLQGKHLFCFRGGWQRDLKIFGGPAL